MIEKCGACPFKNAANVNCINQKMGFRAYCAKVEQGNNFYIQTVKNRSLGEDDPVVPPPTIADQVASATSAAVQFFKSGFKLAKDTTADERLAICNECEHFVKDTERCGVCWCWMKIKTKLPGESCPLQKWGIETE